MLGNVLSELIDVLDIALWRLDTDYKITALNRKATKIYGEGVVGEYCYRAAAERNTTCDGCPVKKIYEGAESARSSRERVDVNGNRIYIDQFAAPIKDKEGRIEGALELIVDVTEHRQIEYALDFERRQLLSIFDSLDEIIYVADPQTYTILYANTALKMASDKELIGKICYEALQGKDHPCEFCTNPIITKKKGRPYHWEYHNPANGKYFSITDKIIKWPDGRDVRFEFAKNITERKRIENQIIRAKNEWMRTFDAVPDFIAIIDDQHRFIRLNKAMAGKLDISPQKAVGSFCYKHFHGTDKPPEYCPHTKSLADGQAHSVEIHEECLGGNFLVTTSPIHDRDGRLMGSVHVTRDITQQKKAEDALRESEERHRSLVESSSDAIIMLDPERKVVSCNKAFEGLFGYSKEEVLGKSVRGAYMSKQSYEQFYQRAYPIVNKQGSFRTERLYVRKDGTRFQAETVISAIRERNGAIEGYVAIIRDISERKQAEEERRKLEAQLLQSEKMASIGQLAAGVAHEINNPTGFVSSNLKTLSDYQNDIATLISHYKNLVGEVKNALTAEEWPVSMIDRVEKIMDMETEVDLDYILTDAPDLIQESREGTERIKKIVLDLKDFAHPGEDTLKPADINKNLDSTLNVVWNELKYKASVVKDYGDLPQVACYPQQLNQVFMNLLVNAAQAIEKEGEIKIVTRQVNGYAEIKISDSGVGIPEQNLSKVFDPFFTTKEVGQGTGLGLNLAYNIINKHHGSIDVESVVGGGTTFTIKIPTKHEGNEG